MVVANEHRYVSYNQYRSGDVSVIDIAFDEEAKIKVGDIKWISV